MARQVKTHGIFPACACGCDGVSPEIVWNAWPRWKWRIKNDHAIADAFRCTSIHTHDTTLNSLWRDASYQHKTHRAVFCSIYSLPYMIVGDRTRPTHPTIYIYSDTDAGRPERQNREEKKKRLMVWLIYNFPDIKKLVNEICCRQYFSFSTSFFASCPRSNIIYCAGFAFLRWHFLDFRCWLLLLLLLSCCCHCRCFHRLWHGLCSKIGAEMLSDMCVNAKAPDWRQRWSRRCAGDWVLSMCLFVCVYVMLWANQREWIAKKEEKKIKKCTLAWRRWSGMRHNIV